MARKKEVCVRKFIHGEKVGFGERSFSNLILTKSTVGENKNMLGYSVFETGIDTKQKIHIQAEELAFVVSGKGKITVGSKIFSFSSGDSLYIPPGVPHGVRNDGKEDVVMVFFFSSPSYPETKDA